MPPKLPFDLNEAVACLSEHDPRFGAAIDKLGTCTYSLRNDSDPFEALLRTIIYQQLAGSAARVIHERVLAIAGHPRPDPKQLLRRRDSTLAQAGLSRNKIAAVRDLARKCVDSEVPDFNSMRHMDNEAITEQLVKIRGIGPWTVQMLLIFNLGRPDVFPVSDLGIRKGYQVIFRSRSLPTEKTLLNRGRRWRPWRSVASWFLWRVADGSKDW